MTDVRPKSCDRARLWVSLGLDDELSDFERRLFDAHLEHCAECREYDRGTWAATELLRMEPLVTPARSVVLPRRPRRAVRAVHLVAPVASAAVALVAFFGIQESTQRLQAPVQRASGATTELNVFRAERRTETIAKLSRAIAASGRVNRGAGF
jgi:ferric-dicitrate binding protein FerR (iron transport regulator)